VSWNGCKRTAHQQALDDQEFRETLALFEEMTRLRRRLFISSLRIGDREFRWPEGGTTVICGSKSGLSDFMNWVRFELENLKDRAPNLFLRCAECEGK
jgi:hypothetical protein